MMSSNFLDAPTRLESGSKRLQVDVSRATTSKPQASQYRTTNMSRIKMQQVLEA
jgi:hypothetical protein